MPGVGVTIFLRYLTTTQLAFFVFVDSFSLPVLSKKELFILLGKELGITERPKTEQEIFEACKQQLRELTLKHATVVIIFNRFDQLKKEFDKCFFGNIQDLQNVNSEKISIIVTSNTPLYELDPEIIGVANLKLFSTTFFLKPYSIKDTQKLLRISPRGLKTITEQKKVVDVSSGHYQLQQLLLKSERLNNPILDKFISLQLREIYESLTYKQKRTVQRITMRKHIADVDEYLINVGVVKREHDSYSLFSSLFTQYVLSQVPLKLAIKEEAIFRLLKKNKGKIIKKDEIFSKIWGDNFDNASDWALNSLLYRLRKNKAFIGAGYIIESYKKQGYVLLKNK